MPITTKLGMMASYLDRLLPIMSHNHSITWSFEIKWQTKNIIFLLPQWFWLPNLAGWIHTITVFFSINSQDPWSRDLARSNDKLNMLHRHYHNDCDHQSWQGGLLHTIRSFLPRSTTTSLMVIKVGKVMNYYKGLPCIKTNKPLKMWSHEIT